MFDDNCNTKPKIKETILANNGVNIANKKMHDAFEGYWSTTKENIKNINVKKNVFEFKNKYSDLLEKTLVPIGILDNFQSIGVFANWWDHSYTVRESTEFETSADGKETKVTVKEIIMIKNVFKTISAEGFVAALVSNEKIANEHFAKELLEIEELENQIASAQSEFDEYLNSIEMDTDSEEDGEEKEVSEKAVRKYLNELIKATSSKKDIEQYKKQLKEIRDLKKVKTNLNKILKQKSAALIEKIDAIRAKLNEKQCEELIMQTLHESFVTELDKYLKAEVDKTIKAVWHLYDKYFVSVNTILSDRKAAEDKLNYFLERLGYING